MENSIIILVMAFFLMLMFSRGISFRVKKSTIKEGDEYMKNFLATILKPHLSKAKDPDGRRWIIKEVEELEYRRPVLVKGIIMGISPATSKFSKMDMLVLPTWRLVAPINNVVIDYNERMHQFLDIITEIIVRDSLEIYSEVGGENVNTEDVYRYERSNRMTYEHWIEEIVKKRKHSLIEKHAKSFNATRNYYERIKEATEKNPDVAEILEKLDEFTCGVYKEGTSPTDESENSKAVTLSQMRLEEGFIHGLGFAITELKVLQWEVD